MVGLSQSSEEWLFATEISETGGCGSQGKCVNVSEYAASKSSQVQLEKQKHRCQLETSSRSLKECLQFLSFVLVNNVVNRLSWKIRLAGTCHSALTYQCFERRKLASDLLPGFVWLTGPGIECSGGRGLDGCGLGGLNPREVSIEDGDKSNPGALLLKGRRGGGGGEWGGKKRRKKEAQKGSRCSDRQCRAERPRASIESRRAKICGLPWVYATRALGCCVWRWVGEQAVQLSVSSAAVGGVRGLFQTRVFRVSRCRLLHD